MNFVLNPQGGRAVRVKRELLPIGGYAAVISNLVIDEVKGKSGVSLAHFTVKLTEKGYENQERDVRQVVLDQGAAGAYPEKTLLFFRDQWITFLLSIGFNEQQVMSQSGINMENVLAQAKNAPCYIYIDHDERDTNDPNTGRPILDAATGKQKTHVQEDISFAIPLDYQKTRVQASASGNGNGHAPMASAPAAAAASGFGPIPQAGFAPQQPAPTAFAPPAASGSPFGNPGASPFGAAAPAAPGLAGALGTRPN